MFRLVSISFKKDRQKILWAAGTVGGFGTLLLAQKTRLEPAKKTQTAIMPSPRRLPTRQEQLQRLSSGKQFDVLVVGGGATGCGVALDAQMRSLETALIERGDFSSETSSKSTKLIWAGIKYLATAAAQLLQWQTLMHPIESVKAFSGEFKMVLGAHKERRILVENNPHLTNWVPIAVPMKNWIVWPPPFDHPLFCTVPIVFPGVMKFYDGLSGFSCPPSHLMFKQRARRKFPQLDDDVKYVQIFYEAQHNDCRTATCIALTAAEENACVTNYTEMVGILKDEQGKAVGIRCRDNIAGKEFDVQAKSIIFAGGPFTDEMRKLEEPKCQPAVNAAAGTHIVLPGYYSPDGIGLLDINTSDGRFLFFLPWLGHTLVGTTDRKGPAVSDPGPPEVEIRWLLEEAKKYLADDLKVRRADVLSAWQGFRPLASDPHAPPGAPVSRDHVISVNPETEITFITGGKWVTYREMAEDVVDRVVKLKGLEAGPCRSETRPLYGGVGYTKNLPIQLVQQFGVSETTAKHLASTYGTHAFDVCKLTKPSGKRWPRFGRLLIEGYPYLDVEVEYACKHEMACTVTDMLTLRTRLAYLNSEAAMEVAPKVADLMAKALGWGRAEKRRQLEAAQKAIACFGGPRPHVSKSANSLTTGTGSVSDIVSLWERLDRDKKGYLDLEDLKFTAKRLGAPFQSDWEAARTFKRMDADRNGLVAEEEFVHWWHNVDRKDSFRKALDNQFPLSPSQ
ncbi:3-phosphate dehydrogenase, mitochondrial [Seminavis robusta]|uniref:glycerol-3-phosphate dehydrogenase n=1 Tax=Seminavis robusta TaxID=568900 RepID=A0A9N8DPE3_9STRA|nr:3-phosphate dehydrogenase, mitochondrial [Seminavis robusta]|eukprot:Sro276_g105890.1 3-phosphate dehydrogenase, mitochondrial (734) ;mRNA; f:5844-8373